MSVQENDNPLAKFDSAALKGIETSSGDYGASRALFQPNSMGEAMEIAKLMAAGNFVPPHLRGKPGDCLAVVMQAARWGLDPFAVGNKTYFVNDRMAYEAQLVIAVLNTSGVLKGRLQIEWDRSDTDLVCTVTGTLKSDPQRPKAVEQKMSTIKVKNSPLWVASPQQQIGYYTSRLWARLFAPEVLLGVYTVDEIEEMGIENARPVPTAPTRKRVSQQREPEQEQPVEMVIEGQSSRVAGAAELQNQPDESEEEIARRLDAEQEAARQGQTDEQVDVAAEIDWSPTLQRIEDELDSRANVIDANSYWESVKAILDNAPESVVNRATGLKNARIAELKGSR
tara:strand:- start:16 stop:1035 length:1020 start_codon:yes stop_codon:yes gene_type:complete